MGGFSSRSKDYWEANKDIFEDEIHFRRKDINRLHTKFINCDIRDSGLIKADEFFAYFQLEPDDAMNQKIFYSFDMRKDGKLDFCQFVCTLWNFLSLPVDQLGAYAHFLFDEDKNGKSLRPDQAKELIEVLYQQKCEKNSRAKKIYDKFSKDKFVFSVIKFTAWTKANTSLLSNLIGLHLKLQSTIIGKDFWDMLSAKRGGGTENNLIRPLYIYQVLDKRYKEMELEKKRQEEEAKALEESKQAGEKELDETVTVDKENLEGDEGGEEGDYETREEDDEVQYDDNGNPLKRNGIILPSLEEKPKKRRKKKKKGGKVVSRHPSGLSEKARIAILEEEETRKKEEIRLQKKRDKRDQIRRDKRAQEEKELELKNIKSAVLSVTFARRLSQRLTASMSGVEKEHMKEKLREDRQVLEREAGMLPPNAPSGTGETEEEDKNGGGEEGGGEGEDEGGGETDKQEGGEYQNLDQLVQGT